MNPIIGGVLIALATMPVHAAEDRESATNILPYCKDRDVAGCAEVIRRLTALMIMPAEDRESAANVPESSTSRRSAARFSDGLGQLPRSRHPTGTEAIRDKLPSMAAEHHGRI